MSPTLRVAAFTRYSRLGASSRLRFLQFAPWLHEAGIAVDVHPLFDDDYLLRLYGRGQRSKTGVAAAYARRWIDLRRATAFDVWWVEKELFPYLPLLLERLAQPRPRPVVLDFDDAVFHHYDHSRHLWVRRLLGRKIDDLMAGAACVTAGNGYLAERARRAGAHRVEIVPTVVDIGRYAPKAAGCAHPEPRIIGWIGSPATEHYLFGLAPVLRELCAAGRARVVLIGASPAAAAALRGVPVEVQPWSEATEAARIAAFDIGIMPLPDEPWERGKCGYKLIQYMACALPVVASPVGVNRDIVEHGTTGLLATDLAAWKQALGSLLDDAAWGRRLGEAGRRRAETAYALPVQGARIAAVLRAAAAGGT